MKTTKLFLSALTLSILLAALSPAAYAIGVTPLRGIYKAAPGETVEGSVIAQNTGDAEQLIVLTKSDFFVGEDESMQFIPEVKEDNMYSMQNWIEFPENNVLTQPGGGAELKYTITVPADAASHAYYAAIFVQGKSPTAAEGSVSVGASVAHLVLLEVTGDLKSELTFKNFSLTAIEPDPEQAAAERAKNEARFETLVHNTGNTHTAPDGKIVIYNADKTAKEEILLNKDSYNAMPERDKTLTNKLDYTNYEPGQYYGELNLKLAEDKTYEAYIPFEVKADKTLLVGEMKAGKAADAVAPTAAATEQPTQAAGAAYPAWAPYAIGGAAGLIFVIGLVIVLAKKSKKNK